MFHHISIFIEHCRIYHFYAISIYSITISVYFMKIWKKLSHIVGDSFSHN